MIHERQNEPTALMTITNLALHNQILYTMAAHRVSTNFTFFSDRIVYIILNIDRKSTSNTNAKNVFLNFVMGYTISKNTGRRILIFAPIDSETHVSYLSIIHFDTS